MEAVLLNKNSLQELIVGLATKLSKQGDFLDDFLNNKLDLEEIRKLNERVIKQLRHKSVSEHAYFNFYIKCMRYQAEYFQKRLTSVTEMSQRYQKIEGEKLSDIFYIPKIDNENFLNHYITVLNDSLDIYNELIEQGFKREDARYYLPISTFTKFIWTINASELSHTVKTIKEEILYDYNLTEQFSDEIINIVNEHFPSILPEIKPDLTKKNHQEFFQNLNKIGDEKRVSIFHHDQVNVNLISMSPNVNKRLLFFKIFKYMRGLEKNFDFIINYFSLLFKEKFRVDFKYDNLLDIVGKTVEPDREFESVDLNFEVDMSSSCYAQIKRHRMMTIIPSRYDYFHFYLPSVFETMDKKMQDKIMNFLNSVKFFYERFQFEPALLNCNMRKVIIKTNLRQLIKFLHLRLDSHAQEEIRIIAEKMLEIVLSKIPNFNKIF